LIGLKQLFKPSPPYLHIHPKSNYFSEAPTNNVHREIPYCHLKKLFASHFSTAPDVFSINNCGAPISHIDDILQRNMVHSALIIAKKRIVKNARLLSNNQKTMNQTKCG
jgi:hypothetical protein